MLDFRSFAEFHEVFITVVGLLGSDNSNIIVMFFSFYFTEKEKIK